MKRFLGFFLALVILLSVASAALAAGAPIFTKHPESVTIDENGTATFKIQAKKYKGLTWKFVNPETGEEVNGGDLAKMFKAEKLKVIGPNKPTIKLKNVPAAMNGWTVYCRLTGNGYTKESDHVLLTVNSKNPAPTQTPAEETPAEETPAEETPAEETPAEETPAEETPAEETPAEETPAEETPTEETPAEETPAEETPAEEPLTEEQLFATTDVVVSGENVTLYAVDARGNVIEGQEGTSLTFTDSGSVLVKAAGPVKYWTIDNFRLQPTDPVDSFILKDITHSISVSAVLGEVKSADVNTEVMVQVNCQGCTFTYLKGGLKSVASGSVPSGATITVLGSGDQAAGGYSINGGAFEYAGKSSFRIQVTEDTTIVTQ